MIDGKRLLALIPARGGSKRIPSKNIHEIGGKPLIAWSIESALKAPSVDRVVVTTDSEEIAKIAIKYGADVPFLRPDDLASDSADSMDSVLHAIRYLENTGDIYEYLLLLQPTSPMRSAEHIEQSIKLLKEKDADSIVGVTENEHPVEWCNTLSDDLSMDGFYPDEIKGKQSQDFPKRYRINGAIYLAKTQKVITSHSMILPQKCFAYIMDAVSSVDIDEHIDMEFARYLLEKR